jgi:hypothetical protein
MKRFLFLALLAASAPGFSADKRPAPTAAAAEIEHLLDYLSQSRCQFERNGRWHSAAEARAHLERKLRHGRKSHDDPTAEYFIQHAATGSSLSGKAYQVRCPGKPVVVSADWFGAELRRLRAGD